MPDALMVKGIFKDIGLKKNLTTKGSFAQYVRNNDRRMTTQSTHDACKCSTVLTQTLDPNRITVRNLNSMTSNQSVTTFSVNANNTTRHRATVHKNFSSGTLKQSTRRSSGALMKHPQNVTV